MSGILLASTTGKFWYITRRARAYMKMYGFLEKISELYLGKSSRISRTNRQETFI